MRLLSGKIYKVSRVARPELEGSSMLAVRQLRAGRRHCRKCGNDLATGNKWPTGSGASLNTTIRIIEGILQSLLVRDRAHASG